MLTQDRLKELLYYDPLTGEFIRLTTANNNAIAGSIAGGISKDGYISIGINRKYYGAHRLAWLYVYGVWPTEDLDHIDGNKLNNTISNLRECSHAQNMQNRRKQFNNSSGYLGVHKTKSKTNQIKPWKATIGANGKTYFLGYYATPQEAHQAYLDAKVNLHTFNPVPR